MKAEAGIHFEGTFYEYSLLQGDFLGLKSLIPLGASIYLQNPTALEFLLCVLSLGGHLEAIHLLSEGTQISDDANEEKLSFREGEFSQKYLSLAKKAKANFSSLEPGHGLTANLHIYSSGTSGPPKMMVHSIKRILGQFTYQETPKDSFVWGLLFQVDRMSGIQVLLNAYSRNENIVCSSNNKNWLDKISDFKSLGVTAISGTPSLIRLLMRDVALRDLNLKQITLSGEIVDQFILNDLRSTFPNCRVTQIYASTEIGFGFSISDGLSGFPREYLSRDFGRFRLSIVGDELGIDFLGSDNPTNESLFLTGDLVEIIEERVHFIGRRTGVVNVGGSKVSPEEIEESIRGIAGVFDAYVYGVKNSQMGEILVAKVMCSESLTGREIRIVLKTLLPSFKVPAIVEIVNKIDLNSNGKIPRS